MNRRVLLTVVDPTENNAGPKAKDDIEKILVQSGYEKMRLPYNWKSKIAKFKYINWSIPRLFKGEKIGELIMQYPVYSRALMNSFISNYRKNSNGKLYFIIHDLESLRFYSDDPSYLTEEIKWLKEADGIIAHNSSMEKWIRSQGVKTPIVNLEVFDYLNPQPLNEQFEYNKSVCLAGNLRKDEFLTNFETGDVKLKVYGPNPPSGMSKNINYVGQFSPDALPAHLDACFGLVWDGKRLDTCSGTLGRYMTFNSPHKVSLYLSTGIPVIIWKKAAVSNFIEKNNLGITIDTLYELPKILNNLTQEEYVVMKKNVLNIANELRNGERIKSSLSKLEQVTNDLGD